MSRLVQERSRPNKWQERWCHRSEWHRQGSVYGQGYLRHHWPTFYGMCPETLCHPKSCKQDKCVQQLVLAWITIIDWEYKKWLPLIDWFNNRSRLWICRDPRKSNVVALPSPPPSRHLRWVINDLCLVSWGVFSKLRLMSRGVLTRTRVVLSCTRLVLSWPWAILQNYTSRKI
jgi:hypothetical protein